jgi:hypothetical protein
MIQEQIVDYIGAQMKLGVSRDTIKATLTGAGWQVADVEDTLKKVEATKMAVQPTMAQPMAMARPAATAGAPVSSEPQTIKVSDLISSSPSMAAAATPTAKTVAGPKSPLTGPAISKTSAPAMGAKVPDTFQATSYPGMKVHKSHGALITEIVLAVIIVAVGAFAGFLYMQNNNLQGQVSTLNGQSSGVNSQLSALQTQMTASTTALTAQVTALGDEMQELRSELAFYAAPSSTTAGATSTVAISGVVSGGGKALYAITATYGAKVFVVNSKLASVIAALDPLLATASSSATTAQFSGTYIAGTDSITLTAVNGTALQ